MLKLYIFLFFICWTRSDATDRCLHFTKLSLNKAFMDIFEPKIKVELMLYTREIINCSQPLFTKNFVLNNEFKQNKKTVWIIHGYRPFGTHPIWLQKLITVLLSLEDMNIVVVDWNQGATTLIYQRAVQRSWTVAEVLREYIKRMRKRGISLQSFHFIGVSLGAHIAGYLGNHFQGALGRITGIDPAGPGFNGVPYEMRLDYRDAKFVDVIHSDSNGLGITQSIGHIDFYPNGGRKQPGCPKSIFSGLSYIKCGHQRAIFLFLSSLSTKCNLTAYPCNSYKEYQNGKCIDCEAFGFPFCPVTGYYADRWEERIIKREPVGLNAYFDTSSKEPFCFYHYVLDIGTREEIKKKGNFEIKLKDKHGTVETSKLKSDKMKFPAYSETHILAGFYNDFKEISQIILKFTRNSPFLNCYTCQHQIQYIRLRSLNFPERQDLCEEKILLKESIENELNPHFCN